MITGEKVILRPLKFNDFENTIKWRNDAEINTLAMMHPFPVTEELEKEWFEIHLRNKNNKSVYFSIEEKNTKQHIGYTSLMNINWVHRRCNFSIVIGDKNAQGKGFGKEVLSLITNYAFEKLNLKKISLEVISTNKQAIRLYKKSGFHEEGNFKKHFYSNGDYYDVVIMAKFSS